MESTAPRATKQQQICYQAAKEIKMYFKTSLWCTLSIFFFFKEHNLSSRNIINVLNHQNVNLSETYKQKAILTEELEKSNQVKFNKNAQIKSKERNLY